MSVHPKTIEQLFREVRDAGLRVNNLFVRMDGLWQNNLRSKDNMLFFEYGYGPSPQDAIEAALAKFRANNRVRKPMPDPDNRDPLKVGSTKEPTNNVPRAPNALDDDDDLLLGGAPTQTSAEAEEDDCLIG